MEPGKFIVDKPTKVCPRAQNLCFFWFLLEDEFTVPILRCYFWSFQWFNLSNPSCWNDDCRLPTLKGALLTDLLQDLLRGLLMERGSKGLIRLSASSSWGCHATMKTRSDSGQDDSSSKLRMNDTSGLKIIMASSGNMLLQDEEQIILRFRGHFPTTDMIYTLTWQEEKHLNPNHAKSLGRGYFIKKTPLAFTPQKSHPFCFQPQLVACGRACANWQRVLRYNPLLWSVQLCDACERHVAHFWAPKMDGDGVIDRVSLPLEKERMSPKKGTISKRK